MHSIWKPTLFLQKCLKSAINSVCSTRAQGIIRIIMWIPAGRYQCDVLSEAGSWSRWYHSFFGSRWYEIKEAYFSKQVKYKLSAHDFFGLGAVSFVQLPQKRRGNLFLILSDISISWCVRTMNLCPALNPQSVSPMTALCFKWPLLYFVTGVCVSRRLRVKGQNRAVWRKASDRKCHFNLSTAAAKPALAHLSGPTRRILFSDNWSGYENY